VTIGAKLAPRETGVVPAALVGVLAGHGVPDVEIYASTVALAIVVTLLIHALLAGWLAVASVFSSG
jgi:potassium/hydrogen antiporter